jgi:hypothetical protein
MLAQNLSLQEVKSLLAERYYNKRRLGVKVDSRGGSPEVDIESGVAEYFVAQRLGCECNLEITDGNDGGYDMIYKGYTLDVKWLGWRKGTKEPRQSGRIIVDTHKLTAKIYVAVAGCERDGFTIKGWCWDTDLKNEPIWKSDYPDQNGSYDRYAIHTSKLRSIYG